MRIALIALALVAFTAPARAAPSVKQLISAWQGANSTCRGSTKPDSMETQSECDRRSRLGGRLAQIGYCYGMKSQYGAQYVWHRCTANSITSNDLRPESF